ncbi:MAG: hypothetical protein ACR2NZ_07770 [Rubripirellula sp.]
MASASQRNIFARRQKVLLVTGVVLLVAYYCMRAFPGMLNSGIALLVALMVAAVGVFLALLATVKSPRKRRVHLFVTGAVGMSLLVACLPRIRLATLERRLQGLGASVKTATDPGDGLWFQFHGMYLPCALKDQLGDAFFGRIEEVNFSGCTVSVEDLAGLDFGEPLDSLNLSSANMSNDDVRRVSEFIDAKQVLVNSLDVDAETLDSIARMNSVTRIAAVDTGVSKQEAVDFVVRHPTIGLVHGHSATGYGFVFPPVAAP